MHIIYDNIKSQLIAIFENLARISTLLKWVHSWWCRAIILDYYRQEIKMTDALEALIAKAQKVKMTDGQMREQRLSFVYGNTHIENSRITREMVAKADDKVTEEEALKSAS